MRSRRTSGGCWRIRNRCPVDGKDGEGHRKTSAGYTRKRGGKGAFGRGSEGGEYYVKEQDASRRREFAVKRLLGEVAGKRVLPALQGGGVLRRGYGC